MTRLTAVRALLATPKHLARTMAWQRKRGNHLPPWMIFESGVMDAQQKTLEGVRVRCQWRPVDPPYPEKYSFGLYFGYDRVFAYDIDPMDAHHLRGFDGLPFDGQIVLGNHVHRWAEQGYGYVEPLTVEPSMAAYWDQFCHDAAISGSVFYAPTDLHQSGQLSLL
ncbi:hypothetical protein [Thiocystis violascens]|uniref:Uncharacterized protein n=1 Tax=Thiocystis violascens (strain ATCC 17096 / DSM 198 / 6111) TaxID=765911 RepID=I3Y9Y9_THIV6|nr:hypothetical protein [Thiocystis violascens]AFL73807.1 hypothetical protein Thivi_1836 [Thiocystis violascens DSM 198]